MDIETQQQISDLDQLRSEHAKRLRMLELQAARHGRSTPAEVQVEIDEIKAKLVPIDAAIFKLTYFSTMRADVPGNEREGQRIGRAAERALERSRRATVAALMDAELKTEARIDAALTDMRHALYVAYGLVGLAILAVAMLATYVLTKGA